MTEVAMTDDVSDLEVAEVAAVDNVDTAFSKYIDSAARRIRQAQDGGVLAPDMVEVVMGRVARRFSAGVAASLGLTRQDYIDACKNDYDDAAEFLEQQAEVDEFLRKAK